jgi:hypothetical protein
LPTSDDPAGDVVEAGVLVFRRFTLSHPALFMIGFLQTGVPAELARAFRSARENAFARLYARIGRLKQTRCSQHIMPLHIDEKRNSAPAPARMAPPLEATEILRLVDTSVWRERIIPHLGIPGVSISVVVPLQAPILPAQW